MDIRPATEADVPLIRVLIQELAEYENLQNEVAVTEELLRGALFGGSPVAAAIVAYEGAEPVGFALYYTTFSTFAGRPGIWLEDLYVRPTFRRRGFGHALLGRLARVAVERGYGRLEWSVLDWNKPAIGFYEGLGAIPLADWTTFRLTGDVLTRVAAEHPGQ